MNGIFRNIAVDYLRLSRLMHPESDEGRPGRSAVAPTIHNVPRYWTSWLGRHSVSDCKSTGYCEIFTLFKKKLLQTRVQLYQYNLKQNQSNQISCLLIDYCKAPIL